MLRWVIASIHLLALPIGLGAVWVRARAFSGTLDSAGLRRVFLADAAWGIASVLWLSTGLWRAFGGLEKGTSYYLSNPFFHAKMGLFILIVLLELWPMIALVRWRMQAAKGQPVDTTRAKTFARISYVEAALVVLMVFWATAMARGMGL
jgi:putative membrane protein